MASRLRALAIASAVLAACGGEMGVPPYGFAANPLQTFQLESEATTEVDGTAVLIQRVADFQLVAEPLENGTVEIAVILKRYYERVEGAPGGTTEFAISDRGLVTRVGDRPEARLEPDSMTPSGVSVGRLLERPIGGWITDASGVLLGTPWTSLEPILGGVRVIDWLVLALPVLGGEEHATWHGTRPVPALGQYTLGVELPLLYESRPSQAGGRSVRAAGALRRERIELVPGFSGRLELEHAGEAELDVAGRVAELRVDLRVRFEAETGSIVVYRARMRVECSSCARPGSGSNQSAPGESDTDEA